MILLYFKYIFPARFYLIININFNLIVYFQLIKTIALNTELRLNKLLDLLKQDPDDSFLLFAVAKEYEKNGNDTEAILKYTSIIGKDPGYIGTYYHLAKLYALTEEREKALTIYHLGIKECKKVNDMHSMAELTTAMANYEMDLD